MNSKKINYLLIAVLILLGIGIGTAAFYGNKALSKNASTLLDLKLEKNITEEQLKQLILVNKDIAEYSRLESIANEIVPKDKDQAKSVIEISNIAAQNGISISSITFPSSTLGEKETKKSSNQQSNDNKDTENNDAKKAPPVTQVQVVDGIKGVYKMEITVQSDTEKPIKYSQLLNFLRGLENNRRSAQVSSISTTPDEEDPSNLSFTIKINVYLKP